MAKNFPKLIADTKTTSRKLSEQQAGKKSEINI